MRRNFTALSVCFCLCLPLLQARAQVLKSVACKPKAELRAAQAITTTDAQYALPVPLRNIATIKQEDNAVCNLLVRHKAINGGAWLLASKERNVVFKDASKMDLQRGSGHYPEPPLAPSKLRTPQRSTPLKAFSTSPHLR